MTGRMVTERSEKEQVLKDSHVIAVVGLADNPGRPAYGVAMTLQAAGHKVLPVHPGGGQVLGEPIHRSLAELPQKPDLVDVFRNPAHLPGLVEEVKALPEDKRPRVLWFQDGVVHPEAAAAAVAAGFLVVMDDCTARVWHRLQAGR